MTLAVFHDFPGLENGLTKYHDFPERVVTLTDRDQPTDHGVAIGGIQVVL